MQQLAFGQRLKAALSRDALAPESSTTLFQWLEISVLSFGAVALAWWVAPTDPSLSQQRFPWLWFAPVLVALRYGVLPGLLSGAVVVGNVWLAWTLGRLPLGVSETALFGGGLVVLLCGEFSDVWRDRNNRMEETYLYMSERLARLTKRHLLLNLSHDRLEQEMLARPGSLRDALARLRTLSIEAQSDDPMPGAGGLLQLLSQYVNIESAQIYLLEPGDGSYTLGRPVARLGDPVLMSPNDDLLRLRRLDAVVAPGIEQRGVVAGGHLEGGEGEFTASPLPASRAGLLGHASVLGTYAHSDQSSPIRRGLFVRRSLLCQEFGPPPPNAGGVPEVDPDAPPRARFRQHSDADICRSWQK